MSETLTIIPGTIENKVILSIRLTSTGAEWFFVRMTADQAQELAKQLTQLVQEIEGDCKVGHER